MTLGTSLAQLVDGGIARGVRVLDVTRDHAYLVERMPFHHRDPFDRLLVAQAMHEGLAIVSADEQLDAYGPARVWE
jgi:PIN domain nuclease of toxin-antitoxin system